MNVKQIYACIRKLKLKLLHMLDVCGILKRGFIKIYGSVKNVYCRKEDKHCEKTVLTRLFGVCAFDVSKSFYVD